MNNSRPTFTSLLWLLLAVVSAASMAFYVFVIWSSNQPEHFSDLYAPWWGAHELLIHGRNPYSPAVAHEIQTVIYGASATTFSPADPSGIAGGYAYPPFAALLLGPTVYLPFPAVQRIFLGLSVLLALLSLSLWLRALRYRLRPVHWFTVALFVMGSFPALEAIKLQNLSLIAASLIAIALFLLFADNLILAGVFLAASTFKPQFTVVLIPWIALWTFADWRRRRALAWSFLGTLLLLVLVSEWLVPGWIWDFMNVVRAYRHYTYGHSLFDVWLTPTWGTIASGVLLLLVLVGCWPHRSLPADSSRFLLVASLMLAANVVVIPTLAPHAQLLLWPGYLCLLRDRGLLWRSGPSARLLLFAVCTLVAWPWISAFALLIAAIAYPVTSLLRFWEIPLYTSPLLPFAVSVALACLLLAGTGSAGRDDLEANPLLPT